MPLRADRNLFPGINPHLNSFLQRQGWESFHSLHVTHLFEALDAALPSNYYATAEQSLQISMSGDPEQHGRARRTTPDVSIYQTSRTVNPMPAASQPGAQTLTIPIVETMEEEDTLSSILIYQIEGGDLPGEPVTRLELLSPGNKPGGAHYAQYMTKRRQTLRAGLRLIEIDYLHQSRPVVLQVPSYPDGDEGAVPYTILVSDPRPSYEQGNTVVHRIQIGQPPPALALPLAGMDTVNLDFNAVYQHTFESSRLYRILVDYEQEPIQFETYASGDQLYIHQRMREIAQEKT